MMQLPANFSLFARLTDPEKLIRSLYGLKFYN